MVAPCSLWPCAVADATTLAMVAEKAEAHSGDLGISAVAYSLDGKHILSGGDDNALRLWGARLAAPSPRQAPSPLLPALSGPRCCVSVFAHGWMGWVGERGAGASALAALFPSCAGH